MDIRFAHQFIRIENNHLYIEFLGDVKKLPMDSLTLREIRTRGSEAEWFGKGVSDYGVSVVTFDMTASNAKVYGLASEGNLNFAHSAFTSTKGENHGEGKRD